MVTRSPPRHFFPKGLKYSVLSAFPHTEGFQSSGHLYGPSLDPFQPAHIFFCVPGTKTELSIPGVA